MVSPIPWFRISPQAHRGFDVPGQQGSGLGDPHMKRIVRLFCEQLMCPDAHRHIGGLDADDQVVISHVLDPVHLVQRALHQALRRHAAVFFQQRFFQRAAVDAHADGDISLFRAVHHGAHAHIASDISRIDADLVRSVLHGRDRHAVVEVNIRHQRNVDLLLDLCQRGSRLLIRHSTADDLAAGLLQRQDLRTGGLRVLAFLYWSWTGSGSDSAADLPSPILIILV